MTLDEFVLFFREFSLTKGKKQEVRESARHLYICLALDLPNVNGARTQLNEDMHGEHFQKCGWNVPREFERHLEFNLKKMAPPGEMTIKIYNKLLNVLLDTIIYFLRHQSPENPKAKPICCISENQRNISTLKKDMTYLCRYITLDVFENYMWF